MGKIPLSVKPQGFNFDMLQSAGGVHTRHRQSRGSAVAPEKPTETTGVSEPMRGVPTWIFRVVAVVCRINPTPTSDLLHLRFTFPTSFLFPSPPLGGAHFLFRRSFFYSFTSHISFSFNSSQRRLLLVRFYFCYFISFLTGSSILNPLFLRLPNLPSLDRQSCAGRTSILLTLYNYLSFSSCRPIINSRTL